MAGGKGLEVVVIQHAQVGVWRAMAAMNNEYKCLELTMYRFYKLKSVMIAVNIDPCTELGDGLRDVSLSKLADRAISRIPIFQNQAPLDSCKIRMPCAAHDSSK